MSIWEEMASSWRCRTSNNIEGVRNPNMKEIRKIQGEILQKTFQGSFAPSVRDEIFSDDEDDDFFD